MNQSEALQYIKQEHPDLIPALQLLTSSATEQQRAALNVLLTELLKIKGDCVDKRNEALSLLKFRGTGYAGEYTRSQALRHAPDVMIRKLCRIAEVTHEYAGDPAFLDALEARNNG